VNFRALAFAIVVAVLSGTLLVLYARKLEVETSGGSPVRILMVTRPVEPGTVLSEDMVAVRAVPQAYVERRAIRETDRNRVLGLKLETALAAQASLQWTDLAVTTDDRRYLADLLQPGMRAVTVRATHDDQAFALIRPGNRVDIVATLPHPKEDNTRVAVLVAQNLMVLAVGTDMGGDHAGAPGTTDRRDALLTVSATIQQQQQLSLAMEKGRLSVAVKAARSTEMLDNVGELRSDGLFNLPPQRAPSIARPAGPISLSGS